MTKELSKKRRASSDKSTKRSRKRSVQPARVYREPKTVGEMNIGCQQEGTDGQKCGKPVTYFDPGYMPARSASTFTGLICGEEHKPGPKAQKVLVRQEQADSLPVAV